MFSGVDGKTISVKLMFRNLVKAALPCLLTALYIESHLEAKLISDQVSIQHEFAPIAMKAVQWFEVKMISDKLISRRISRRR